MSEKNLKPLSKPAELKRLELEGSVPLIITDEFLDKVKYLCSNIPEVEWSGILFYAVEGSIKNAAEMKITAKDILLMDKGTKAYTEYDWDEEVVNYQMDNPESLDWYKGHIHSHNTMGVFFSGTDWSELNDNCPNHNIYVSLIVNNFMHMTAKIAFTAELKNFICKDEEGKDYSLKITEGGPNPMMFVYSCDVQVPANQIVVPTTFEERYKQVIEAAEKRMEKAKKEWSAFKKDDIVVKGFQPLEQLKGKLDEQKNQKKGGYYSETDRKFDEVMKVDRKQQGSEDAEPGLFDMIAEGEPDDEEVFACMIMRLGNAVEMDDIDTVLEEVEAAMLAEDVLALSIRDHYNTWYNNFWEKHKDFGTPDHYEYTIDAVIQIFKTYMAKYDWLECILIGITTVKNEFNKHLEKLQKS